MNSVLTYEAQLLLSQYPVHGSACTTLEEVLEQIAASEAARLDCLEGYYALLGNN